MYKTPILKTYLLLDFISIVEYQEGNYAAYWKCQVQKHQEPLSCAQVRQPGASGRQVLQVLSGGR